MIRYTQTYNSKMTMSSYKQKFGEEGEKLALTHLIEKGYKILAKNYRSGRAEIDIIAEIDGVYVFVEVKIRETDKYGLPEEAVSTKKINMMAQGAEDYLLEFDLNGDCRYDIVSIIKNKFKTEITHLEDAFWPGLY
ncbi:MAG: YraN family protein [Bacteroidia bacterium]|nr:YraN family protein [Bacteroidia bacterium]NNJ55255.1 YraN family protein [Bacteroidia bacterium]